MMRSPLHHGFLDLSRSYSDFAEKQKPRTMPGLFDLSYRGTTGASVIGSGLEVA